MANRISDRSSVRPQEDAERTGMLVVGDPDATHGTLVGVLDAGADAGIKELLFSVNEQGAVVNPPVAVILEFWNTWRNSIPRFKIHVHCHTPFRGRPEKPSGIANRLFQKSSNSRHRS